MNGDNKQKVPDTSSRQVAPKGISIKHVLARIGAVLGVIAAIIAIWQAIPSKPDDERLLFPDQTKKIQVDADSRWNDQMQGAHLLSVSGVVLNVPDGSVVSANHIRLQNGGRITGRNFGVLATTIEGGSIDATGNDGASGTTPGAAGLRGQDGGTMVVVAARISNTALNANGGDGGAGAVGQDGSDGRNGRCDGFGKWVKANPGGAGGNGGAGGAGGSGGSIAVYHSPAFSIQTPPKSEGGIGGTPGAGGRGGTGGRGCVGLGGSQSNAQNGKPGISGEQGISGLPTTPAVKAVPFHTVVDLMHEKENLSMSMETLAELLKDISR